MKKIRKYIGYFKPTLKVAFPMSVAHVGGQITSMADTIMVGNVSSLHLSAAAIANYLFLIPFLFGLGLSVVITPLIGNSNGAGEIEECKLIFVDSFYYQVINSIVLTVFIYLFGYIVPYLNLDAGTAELAVPYYNWLAFSFVPLAMTFWLKQYFDGFKFSIYGMIAMLVGNLVNILFNWLLIYGHLGFPELKLTGAGIATFISRVIGMLLLFIIAVLVPRVRKLTAAPSFSKFSFVRIKNLYRLGLPMAFQSSLEMSAFSFAGVMAGWLGTVALASYQITMNIVGFAYMAMVGIGSATTVLISTYVGENNSRSVLFGSRSMLILTFLLTFCFAAILLLSRNILPQFYGDDAMVLAIVPAMITVSAAFHVVDGVCASLIGILRGLFDIRIPTAIQALTYWLIMVPFAYLFAFVLNYGVIGIFYGLTIGLTVCCLILFIRYRFIIKKQVRRIVYSN